MLLVKTSEGLINQIMNLINRIGNEEKFPKEWGKALLVTIPKKGDHLECINYRTVSLIPHISNIILNVMFDRLTAYVISEVQAGFRKDRRTIQQIPFLRFIAEKNRKRNNKV